MKKLIGILLLFSAPTYASFYIDYKFNYQTESDDGTQTFESEKMMNGLFLAASLDNDEQFFIGQSFVLWNKSQKQDDSEEFTLDLLELGPKALFYFSEARTWFLSATYNFYAKGDSTLNGSTDDVSGNSFMASLGYHYELSRTVGLGASINYHSVSLDERKQGNTVSDVSETYTSIVPMLELAIRFR